MAFIQTIYWIATSVTHYHLSTYQCRGARIIKSKLLIPERFYVATLSGPRRPLNRGTFNHHAHSPLVSSPAGHSTRMSSTRVTRVESNQIAITRSFTLHLYASHGPVVITTVSVIYLYNAYT